MSSERETDMSKRFDVVILGAGNAGMGAAGAPRRAVVTLRRGGS